MDQKIAELEARGARSASQRVDEYRERYGLDKPVLTQYWLWISNFVQGDFGISFEFDRPVRELIGQRFTLSIILSLATLILTWAIAIPLGVYSAKPVFTWRPGCHRNSIYWPGNTGFFVSPGHSVYSRSGSWSGCSGIVFTKVSGRSLEPG